MLDMTLLLVQNVSTRRPLMLTYYPPVSAGPRYVRTSSTDLHRISLIRNLVSLILHSHHVQHNSGNLLQFTWVWIGASFPKSSSLSSSKFVKLRSNPKETSEQKTGGIGLGRGYPSTSIFEFVDISFPAVGRLAERDASVWGFSVIFR